MGPADLSQAVEDDAQLPSLYGTPQPATAFVGWFFFAIFFEAIKC